MLNLLNNAGKIEKMADHHTCAFGKWYDAHRHSFTNMPEYEDMYATHETFHRIAIKYNESLDTDVLINLLICSNEILHKFILLSDAFKKEIAVNEEYFKGFI
ncbi:MAG: CZB domain-containing protein [Lachnospiraceae bacterium]|nr:CZB domain-containing protein [Lachnospiraceae bacterium]